MVIRTMLRARKARPNRSQRRLSRRCRSFLCPGRERARRREPQPPRTGRAGPLMVVRRLPRTASRSPGRRAAPSRMDTRRRRMGRSRERTDSRALAPHTTRVGLLMVSSLNPVQTPSASPMAELRMVARRLPPRMVSRLQGRRAATAMRLPRPMVSSPSRSMVPARLPLHTVSRLPAVLREGTVSRPHRTAASSRPPRTDSHTAPTSTVTRNTGTSRPQSRRKATAIRTSRNRRRRRAAARSSPASPQVSLPSSPSSS